MAVQNLADYNDKKFVDVSREGIDLGTDEQDKKQVRHHALLKQLHLQIFPSVLFGAVHK